MLADSRIVIKSDSLKIKIALGLGAIIAFVILAFLFRLEFGLILLGLGGLGALGGATALVFWAKRRLVLDRLEARRNEAETRQREFEADNKYWQAMQQKAIAARLTAEQYFIEQKAGTFVIGNIPFRFFSSASASAKITEPLALPAPKLDFFQALSEPHQVYAIVGPQRIGKSILAQHLGQYLIRQGATCLVVGTKAQPGEWLNCRRFIGNEAVAGALGGLLAEVKKRIETKSNEPKLAVFLDDWLNTVALAPDLAEQFFLESATRILTAGIVPYFLLQSDSKADWGTRHGAQLKNNFVHLLLGAPRVDGRLDYSAIRATLIYPGEKERFGVRLPGGLPRFGEDDKAINLELAAPEILLNETEQRVLEMHDAGASLSAIAKEIYGSKGGNQLKAIRDILSKNYRVYKSVRGVKDTFTPLFYTLHPQRRK